MTRRIPATISSVHNRACFLDLKKCRTARLPHREKVIRSRETNRTSQPIEFELIVRSFSPRINCKKTFQNAGFSGLGHNDPPHGNNEVVNSRSAIYSMTYLLHRRIGDDATGIVGAGGKYRSC